jgi:2,4-dienoyl-CoA reductase-like NADH-dependent reductase (Old Yellow Enzyme family)
MLFDPLTFPNGAGARNRVWLAPLTNMQSAADGSLSDDELHFLARRASGGFGVIETCAAHVSLDGQGWQGELGIFDDRLLPGLERLASTLGRTGALAFVQLFHGGARAPAALTGHVPWTASAIAGGAGAEPARAAADAEIWRVIGDFRDAAVRAEKAGFAGVELHGAHGYLLCQFLSATLNLRTDEWGGSAEARARLLRETVRATRSAVSSRFVVGVRLSPEDFGNTRGLDLDESIQVARWLAEDGADFIHLSLWDAARNTQKRPSEHPVPLFRVAIPRAIPIIGAGKIWTRAEAEALLDRGAGAVALGQAAIANPDWARRCGSGMAAAAPPADASRACGARSQSDVRREHAEVDGVRRRLAQGVLSPLSRTKCQFCEVARPSQCYAWRLPRASGLPEIGIVTCHTRFDASSLAPGLTGVRSRWPRCFRYSTRCSTSCQRS